jgi:hypothetical protein
LEPINPTTRRAAKANSHEPSPLLIPASQRLLESRKRPTTITITTIVTINNNNNNKRVSTSETSQNPTKCGQTKGLVGPKKTLKKKKKP